MGFLSFHAGDLASAQKWYEQAIKLDSQSYLAHYYYAAIAMQSGATGNDAAVEDEPTHGHQAKPIVRPCLRSSGRLLWHQA